MKSKCCGLEGHGKGPSEEEMVQEVTGKNGKLKVQSEEDRKLKAELPELSRNQLLHLLGVMEGEVQAREDVILLLRLDQTSPETLEAQYGSSVPTKVLQALQRDGGLLGSSDHRPDHRGGHRHRQQQQDVYEKPMAELERLEQQQTETYRRMLEQLLLAEKCHRRTVLQLDDEKRRHADFMNKSDDFTNLLEQDRERLKRLLEQEKAHQTRQDQEHRRSVEKMSAELLKLQALAIMLLDERQLHIQQIHQHGQNFQDLDRQLQDREQQLEAVAAAAKEDSQRILILEAELEQQVAEFTRQQEEKSGRLVEEEGHSRKLRMKMAALAQQVEELQQSNKLLRVSEENLHELKEKIRQGEQGSSFLSAQLESLKKKVVEMEGQDEEISKLETQCRELKGKLHKEENHSQDLRLQVEQLQGKMAELEKLQGALSNSRAESSQLRTHLEKEKDLVRGLSNKIDTMRHSIKLLENSASNLEKAEVSLKDQLVKMKSLTILLAEERKKVTERLRLEEQRSLKLSRTLEEEQAKVTEVTEKLIDESKKLLKVKSEAENQVTSLVKEKTELGNKLAAEEEKNQHLRTEVGDMKIRVESLEKQEEVEKSERPEKDKKIQELMLELEKLRSRLEQLQVVEGDLMKTEDQYDVLQEKFRREQEKADVLSKNLDEMRSQVARSKVVERKEISGLEAALRIRCKLEEVRTRELQLDVQALREKIQQLMNHEEQLLADRALLQQRLMEEEQRRRISSQEVEKLCQELEASRRVARTFRSHGGRMSSVPVVSTAVQTELEEAEVGGEQTAAGFILRSLLEEQHLMRNLRRQEVRTSEHPPSCKSWLREKGEQRSMAVGTRSLGEPLRIRVTPDPGSSRATLEISGAAAANDFFSSATIVPTLGLQQPRITIHPSAQATPRGDTVGGANSPVSIAKSPAGGANTFTARQRSPLSVITVSAAPVVEAPPPTHHQPTLVTMTPPPANRKLDGGRSSIITTNDNKIHIQLGCQYKRPTLDEVGAGCSSLEGSKGAQSGTSVHLLRCPPQGKMTSSLTITPVTSTSDRPTQTQTATQQLASQNFLAPSQLSSPPSTSSSFSASQAALTRTVKQGGHAVVGVSTSTRLESRGESRSMKIELRRSQLCSSAPLVGRKDLGGGGQTAD